MKMSREHFGFLHQTSRMTTENYGTSSSSTEKMKLHPLPPTLLPTNPLPLDRPKTHFTQPLDPLSPTGPNPAPNFFLFCILTITLILCSHPPPPHSQTESSQPPNPSTLPRFFFCIYTKSSSSFTFTLSPPPPARFFLQFCKNFYSSIFFFTSALIPHGPDLPPPPPPPDPNFFRISQTL